MADWQTGTAGSRAGFGELMDDGLGRMMEEERAIISCQARCCSVAIRGTAMKRQAVIEGDGEVGREREGGAHGRADAEPSPGLRGGILRRGLHSRTQDCPFTWSLPRAAACPRAMLTLGLAGLAVFPDCPISFLA